METPYINDHEYNPNYGDSRICLCGHEYHRHFDSYEDMYACGCKYCRCDNFLENPRSDMNPNEVDYKELFNYCMKENTELKIQIEKLQNELFNIKDKLRDVLND